MPPETEETTTEEPRELTSADFEPTDDEGQQESASSESASGDETQETESQEAGEATGEAEGDADPYADAPEFWAAEHKALWSKDLPPEFRQAVHEHVKQASRAISDKMMEAANARKAAEEQVQKFTQERDQLAEWWKTTGAPLVVGNFQAKWGQMTPEAWQKLAAEDPAKCQQLRIEFDNDRNTVQDAMARHQQEVAAAQERAKQTFETVKRSEHDKLATRLPQYFGADKAQATYDELGKYLTGLGIDSQRVNAIYEAPVIEIAHKAMLYDKLQAALKAKLKETPATATQTPRRVAPGARTGQPNKSDAMRQAEQRLRTGQALSEDDAALLFG